MFCRLVKGGGGEQKHTFAPALHFPSGDSRPLYPSPTPRIRPRYFGCYDQAYDGLKKLATMSFHFMTKI